MINLRRLHASDRDFHVVLEQLLRRDREHPDTIEIQKQVAETLRRVKQHGDSVLRELTLKFDEFDLDEQGIEIKPDQCQTALDRLPKAQREALEFAAERITLYHQHQLEDSWQYTDPDGTTLGQKITPLKRVGLYVPGGKAAYPSSVLMNVIPAKVAGVGELIMATPTPRGETNALVLAAAAIAGVDRIFRIGGAQAIAALTFGTQSVPAVDKITGPGNAWVTAAKQQVFGRVGIDMIAGPSEVLVIADSSANPDWVAMDLFAQAEHDEMAQALLLTTDTAFADAVQQAVSQRLESMPRRAIIRTSLENNGAIIVAESDDQLVQIADQIAAEHLEIFTHNAEHLAEQVSNAGAIFVGPHSAESLGDYCAGPNHVLPTSGTARFSSPLGVYDFLKRTSVLRISSEGAASMAQHAAELARGESLDAHAKSAELRAE